MRGLENRSELLKERTPTFARSGAKATMAEARKLPMDVADETGASAARLAPAQAPRPRDASVASGERAAVRLPESAWKDSRAARHGGRWSPRATLAVSGGVALLLWGLVGLAVSAIR
jgi:hypothetical protein